MTRHVALLILLALLLSPFAVAAADPAPLRVGFLVVDGVYNSELIAPYDIFHHTVFHTDPGMELFIVSPDGETVTSFEGIEIGAHYGFDDAPEVDVLVVPSAEHSMDSDLENTAMIDWVKRVGATADYVVSLCDGAFVLAAAGLLDDVASTTFPGDVGRYEDMFPDLDVRRDVSFVHDGKALTSQGGARSYDVAMYLVDHLYGEVVAQGVGRGMVLEWPDTELEYVAIPDGDSPSGPRAIDCADGDALARIHPLVQHQDGAELHQVWLLADHPDLWRAAPAEPASLKRFRRQVQEVVDDATPLGLIRRNREMFPWLERHYPAVREINRAIEAGTAGQHRAMSCLESQILGFQAARFPLFDQPSEIVALVLRRGEGPAAEVKVYVVADDDDVSPKPIHALEALPVDLSRGWRLWDTFHNHTFELDSERGHLAVAAPSSNDLGVFVFLRERFGLEHATVSDGFSTLELSAADFEVLARTVEPETRRSEMSPTAEAAPVAATEAILPPAPPWNGKSRGLVVPPDHEWVTPSERTALTRTPRYDETVSWLERLVAAAPELEMISLGKSDEGRELWMVVASLDGSTPEAIHQGGKPVLLAHAGIHSGEIDGKDAGLMLLRDMTVRGTRRYLLEQASFLFVPILNVDGHERFSPHNRMNQRGPVEMGWRTNRRNLNLNRDFAKLDTPEVRALVAAINRWQPDLYLDLHVTDGADYQYDITFGYNGAHAWSPAIADWLDEHLSPALERDLEAVGHIPGPLVFVANGRDLTGGLFDWTAGPRFSNGFGDARHLPSVLVENHSLKPYDQRVLGTYTLLESALRTLGERFVSLRVAVEQDKAALPRRLSLGWKQGGEPRRVSFKAIRSELEDSPVTGDQVVRWTGQPELIDATFLPFEEPTATVSRPEAYYIPAAWSRIADRLALHGIEIETLSTASTVAVEMYRLATAKLAPGDILFGSRNPFEGHARVEPGEVVVEERELSLPAGSFRVSTDQPLGDLAMLLLEPQSPDSFFQWGFLLEILSRTEYFEPYVLAPMAERMLDEDSALAEAFRDKLASDAEFSDSPRMRLEWFYERTPFYDDEYRLYPIARGR